MAPTLMCTKSWKLLDLPPRKGSELKTVFKFLSVILVLLALAPAPGAQTLDEVIAKVKAMKARGASNDDIARYVSLTVDNRMVNANGWEGVWYRWGTWNTAEWAKHEGYLRDRENVSKGDGNDAANRARWAWNLQYGQCGEASAITYTILTQAGVPSKMVEVPGHAYTVIGLNPNQDVTRQDEWGDNVRVVDGWLGDSFTPSEARSNFTVTPGPANSNYDRTGGRLGPSSMSNEPKAKLHDATDGNDAETIRKKHSQGAAKGGVHVIVVGPKGQGVPGAVASLSGPSSGQSVADSSGWAYFSNLKAGAQYVVNVVPPAGAGMKAAAASFTVIERKQLPLRVRLERTEEVKRSELRRGSGTWSLKYGPKTYRGTIEATLDTGTHRLEATLNGDFMSNEKVSATVTPQGVISGRYSSGGFAGTLTRGGAAGTYDYDNARGSWALTWR